MDATVIGGGFAGVEAAMQLARRGVHVRLYEMKPGRFSPAHKSPALCELVCSNSFKAARVDSAAGLLKAEMELLGSVTVPAAKATAVPAGGALAVDRDAFSAKVSETVENEPNIEVVREEVTAIPETGVVIVAAGPLASEALSGSIEEVCGERLHFFDAAAPIVTADSIDMSRAFRQSRYEKGGDDYINCPMNKAEYEAFYEALVSAERAPQHAFDERRDVYEGCMPIEIMARRGENTIRFGPMKPVGLVDPATGHRPWAVLQLRSENSEGTMYNLVGFQTNLKFGEQKRVFGMIPALAGAEFVRYGVMHRNSFLHSPGLLNAAFQTIKRPTLFFAGQITGVEGYMESAASGILAGINAANVLAGKPLYVPPAETMTGALARYIADESIKSFQPMGAAMGLLPAPETRIRDKRLRYAFLADRALKALEESLRETRE
ncbi:MAG: methylenetetrahydrofolate--tRNA-(uracil(54)-C(5))-methyltransferase (FADH(2)-oxidizing) TrmFO [Clostridia bacterium]|nr:methylenetetrahydrofolate--tRNA-(uracil(54)-C(5))-methyltransferase (FADH(2)-oxidizing) TrmFO [Clostridia bacterium]